MSGYEVRCAIGQNCKNLRGGGRGGGVIKGGGGMIEVAGGSPYHPATTLTDTPSLW